MNPDDHVCLCFHVSRRKLENYARIERPTRASQLSQCGGAGTGCGWCVPMLERLFRHATEPPTVDAPADASGLRLPSPAEYAEQRKTYIRNGKSHSADPNTEEAAPPDGNSPNSQ